MLKRFTYYLYLFQLENYNLPRFFRVARANLWKFNYSRRQKLVWTAKARTIFILALLLFILCLFVISLSIFFLIPDSSLVSFLFVLGVAAIFYVFFFIFLIAAARLLQPLDFWLKHRILNRTKRLLRGFPHLKIIAITGSYGKTTTKEILFSVLSQKYQVLKTPENINTPLGIARFLEQELKEDHQLLIVEMGAHQKGDIKELCELTPPNISILTGINEAHLERFGSLKNTISAKFELIDCTLPDGLVIINSKDPRVLDNYADHLSGRRLIKSSDYRLKSREIFPDGSGQKFTLIKDSVDYGPYEIRPIPRYVTNTAAMVIAVAEDLNLSPEQIKVGLVAARPTPHRLEATLHPHGVLVIDDSYNGNPEGVKEAIRTMSELEAERKIFVTPGLVELGDRSGAIHRQIGHDLSEVADQVFLIQTSASTFIRQGLLEAGFAEENIRTFSSMKKLEADLPRLLQNGDLILFQNDWPDNYS